MITISMKDDGRAVGQISEQELQFLVDHFEEESSTDQDYFINGQTLDMLAQAGASAALIDLLRKALGGSDGADIVWART
jgi:hypothetical protein